MATNWTQLDQLPDLAGTCLDGTTAVDLTAATAVTVHIRRADGTVLSRAVVPGAGVGTWTMQWQATDLTVPGQYTVEVEATWPGAKPQTFAGATFNVGKQLA